MKRSPRRLAFAAANALLAAAAVASTASAFFGDPRSRPDPLAPPAVDPASYLLLPGGAVAARDYGAIAETLEPRRARAVESDGGAAIAETLATPPPPPEMQALPFALRAVIRGHDGTLSCIVALRGGEQRSVFVGDALEGFRLVEAEPLEAPEQGAWRLAFRPANGGNEQWLVWRPARPRS